MTCIYAKTVIKRSHYMTMIYRFVAGFFENNIDENREKLNFRQLCKICYFIFPWKISFYSTCLRIEAPTTLTVSASEKNIVIDCFHMVRKVFPGTVLDRGAWIVDRLRMFVLYEYTQRNTKFRAFTLTIACNIYVGIYTYRMCNFSSFK